MILGFILFIRFYIDLLIDKIFAVYWRPKQIVSKPKNPIVMESATSLAKKIRTRKLTSEQVVQAFIDRIKEVNPIINSVVDHRFEAALKEARQIDEDIACGSILDVDFRDKPFLGVPFTTKESTACAGLSFTFGLKKRVGKKATFDADCVSSLKEAGAICLGVTNVPQLNLWQETSNPVYGITRNPYDTTRNVGGSSGGESSILAACGSPIGIGTDIGGSVRIPAFMCGVFGHKPTSHLISTRGLTFRTGDEEQTIVVVGCMTKFAEDLIPFLKVLVGKNVDKLKLDRPVFVNKLKVYYVTDPRDPLVSPFRDEMKNVLSSAVEYFSEISGEKPQPLSPEGLKHTGKLWRYWMSRESNVNFKRDINNREGEVSAWGEIMKYFARSGDFTLPVILNLITGMFKKVDDEWARTETKKLKEQLLSKLDDNAVLLYPSAPFPAGYHHTPILRPYNFNLLAIWNVLKFPATQVPMGLGREGLPLGLQVVAAPYQDRLCIAVAKELERKFGGYVPPFRDSM
ncbi:fatty-acid amide hydrolase 2-like [Cylas formicarius]|uniref:fatty-acid amide hydrolase 2-like n=1 Tax=Cylas formicarius TaxID=197179 RepID=UPI0029583F0E|nr:fatty-acid amide hydrolase 2-like [Cylas formicarius]